MNVRSDDFYMARALAVAERGRGRTSPNPMVGAVIVDAEGVVVGSGSHEVAGGPHAEVDALAEAGSRARGATLYCTLEPCSHTGRTPPCAPQSRGCRHRPCGDRGRGSKSAGQRARHHHPPRTRHRCDDRRAGRRGADPQSALLQRHATSVARTSPSRSRSAATERSARQPAFGRA